MSGFGVLVAFAFALMAFAPHANAGETHVYQSSFDGADTPEGSFAGPNRMAVHEGDELLYVVDQDNDTVLKYEISDESNPALDDFSDLGSPAITEFGDPAESLEMGSGADVAVDDSGGDNDGTIYLTVGQVGVFNPEPSRTFAYSETGEFLYEITDEGDPVDATGIDVVASGSLAGDIYMYAAVPGTFGSDPEVQHWVAQPDGSEPALDEATSFDPGSSSSTGPLAVSADGSSIYTAPGITRYDDTGSDQAQLDSSGPEAIAVDSDNGQVFAAYTGSGGFLEVYTDPSDADPDAPLYTFGSDNVSTPAGVSTFGVTGMTYASDSGGNEVDLFVPGVIPDVTVEATDTIGIGEASFNGTVNPLGMEISSCEFQYGTSSNYSDSVPCEPSDLGTGTDPVDVSAEVEGLSPGEEYHFRLRATNDDGPNATADHTYTAEGPLAETDPAGTPTPNGTVLLGGSVDANGSQTEWWLEYGTDSSLDEHTRQPASGGLDAGDANDPVLVDQEVEGLEPQTEYFFRVVARADSVPGRSEGQIRSFTIPAPPDPQPTSCPNEDFRVGPSSLLDDCRAYELVSDVDMFGGSLTVERGFSAGSGFYPSEDGSAHRYAANSIFGDARDGVVGYYIAQRGEDGWENRNVNPEMCYPEDPAVENSLEPLNSNRGALTSDFMTEYREGNSLANCDPDDHDGGDIYAQEWDGTLEWISQNGEPKTEDLDAEYATNNRDGSHVLFTTSEVLSPVDEDRESGEGLYDRTSGQAVPVGLDNSGELLNPCGAEVPGDYMDTINGGISVDGDVIFLTTGVDSSTPGCSQQDDDAGQIYARIDHDRTVQVSESQRSTEDPDGRQIPYFLGSSDDGTVAYFASSERLNNDATEDGGLYKADLTDPVSGSGNQVELEFIGGEWNGSSSGSGLQQRLSGMTSDGALVYFVTTENMTSDASGAGSKIYSYDGDEVRLAGPTSASRAASSSNSPDGSKLIYYQNVSGSDEIHLYDRDTDLVTCVTCRRPGVPTGGQSHFISKSSLKRPAALGVDSRVTNEGHVYFDTEASFVDRDSNGRADVYEYHEGEFRILSRPGRSHSWFTGVTADGSSVFFLTNESLAPRDTDNGSMDVYSARVNGGFAVDREPPECQGESCLDPSPEPPAEEQRGTTNQDVLGNWQGRPEARIKLGGLRRAQAVRLARRGQGAIRVGVNRPGTVRATIRARVGRQVRTVGIGRARAQQAGVTAMRLRLSKPARRLLLRRGQMRAAIVAGLAGTEARDRRQVMLRIGNRAARRASNAR